MYRHLLTATNIKRLRLEKGYTGAELARRLGIQTGRLASMEKGATGIGPKMEEKLCEVFGCEPEELYKPSDGLPEMLEPVVKTAVEIFEKSTLEKQHELCAKLLKGLRDGD